MLRSANLESRQSRNRGGVASIPDAPLREFGIKAKHICGRRYAGRRCSAPRIWNQGKAADAAWRSATSMLRSANLESRQSARHPASPTIVDAPLREFGIKAKLRAPREVRRGGCSAPRIWNQGKAARACGAAPRPMLRSANLESRQSTNTNQPGCLRDAPLREFGIKAKHGRQ